MKKVRVGIKEIHISYREVEVEDGATEQDIVDAALDAEETVSEYVGTVDDDYDPVASIKELSQ